MIAVSVGVLLTTGSSALGRPYLGSEDAPDSPPIGAGKTVSYSLSRSGSAGVSGGACGTRLQCFKTAITAANANTTSIVENAAFGIINVAEPDQDVNLGRSGKQLLIAPAADPNGNGNPDLADAVSRVSLGGGTCFTCALQAAERSFVGARVDSQKVIILVSERINTFRSTGFTSGGEPTGYPPMELWQMAGHFDANTVVRAFAVGPSVTCSADPNGYGSLNDAAAVTSGGTCTNVASFVGLSTLLTDAVTAGGPVPPPPPPPPPQGPPPPPPPPPPTGGQAYAEAVRADAPRAYWRLGELSGTVAAEDQARANGTYTGGVVLGVEPAIHDANTAARFDGGNDKVSVSDPANGSLDFGVEDFTVELWTKADASDERGVVSKRSPNAVEPFWDITVTDDPNHNGQIRAVYFDGTNVRTAYSTNTVADGLWHHVVVWFDRDGGITIFTDGSARFTALAMTPDVSNTGEVQIGKSATHPYFRGDLDEVALYGGLLSLQRIQAHLAAA